MNRSTEEVLSFDEAMEKYDPVLGFEVHVELSTRTKMFDAAPNVFGDEPNTNVTPVSLGLPGVLPDVGSRRPDLRLFPPFRPPVLRLAVVPRPHRRGWRDVVSKHHKPRPPRQLRF